MQSTNRAPLKQGPYRDRSLADAAERDSGGSVSEVAVEGTRAMWRTIYSAAPDWFEDYRTEQEGTFATHWQPYVYSAAPVLWPLHRC